MLAFKVNLYASYFWLSLTAKSDCAYDFWLVFESAQLLLSIDLNSWAGSKTSQKVPSQTVFAVISKSNELGIPYKSIWRIFQHYEKEPRIYLAQIMNRRPQLTKFTNNIETISIFINSRDTPFMIREIQSFVNAEIGVSLKQQQIVEYLRKNLNMTYRRVNSRSVMPDNHHKLMLLSLFVFELSNILRAEIVIVSID